MRAQLLGPRARAWSANLLLIGAALFFSLLPDSDSAAGIWYGNFGRYHNNLTHSLIMGLAVAAVAGWLAPLLSGARYRVGFLFVLLCYELHVLMDYVTVGRGVMALWPLTDRRFQSPVKLFVGLHWSEGWVSSSHLLTLANELAFALVLYLGYRLITARRNSGSRSADQL